MNRINPEELEELFTDRIAIEVENMNEVDDKINHPSHYTYGKIECIDFIIDKELDFCRGNAIKYIIRAGKKSGESIKDDISKAIFYLNKYMEKYGG